MGRIKTLKVKGTLCVLIYPQAHFRRLQIRIFGFSQKETGTKSVAMATT